MSILVWLVLRFGFMRSMWCVVLFWILIVLVICVVILCSCGFWCYDVFIMIWDGVGLFVVVLGGLSRKFGLVLWKDCVMVLVLFVMSRLGCVLIISCSRLVVVVVSLWVLLIVMNCIWVCIWLSSLMLFVRWVVVLVVIVVGLYLLVVVSVVMLRYLRSIVEVVIYCGCWCWCLSVVSLLGDILCLMVCMSRLCS